MSTSPPLPIPFVNPDRGVPTLGGSDSECLRDDGGRMLPPRPSKKGPPMSKDPPREVPMEEVRRERLLLDPHEDEEGSLRAPPIRKMSWLYAIPSGSWSLQLPAPILPDLSSN